MTSNTSALAYSKEAKFLNNPLRFTIKDTKWVLWLKLRQLIATILWKGHTYALTMILLFPFEMCMGESGSEGPLEPLDIDSGY